MWLCSQLGFFSIAHKDTDTFHIRARCREDLDQLAKAAGTGSSVASFRGSDYPWRIICHANELPAFMQALTASIDYGNFKSAIGSSPTQRSKLAAYHDIHHRMVEWQAGAYTVMKRETSVQNLLFDVDQVPVEAVIGTNGHTRRINIPTKKALIHQGTGHVLGVVGRDYRVVTNREAVNLAQEVCGKAFPGLSSIEWEARRASAPRTLSYAHIDLMHRTHVLNYLGSEIGQSDPYTPFLRVTNSFNGARALRFDIGFMRKHCSNGVIFEEEVATIKASHSKEALAQLQIEITGRSLPQMWDEFSKFLTTVRSITMTADQSTLAVKTVLHLPDPKPDDKPARKEALDALAADFSARLTGYRHELGENAYAVFNTLTDIAARPPDLPCFQQTRDTIERRSGRWLKELARQSQAAEFNLERWISAWEVGMHHQISDWN